MHASLTVNGKAVLACGDFVASIAPGKLEIGNNVSIILSVDTDAEADKILPALAAGGAITMPLAEAFFKAYFGMCTDKFGIHWMIIHDKSMA